MRAFFLFLLILTSFHVHAQDNKPTGGCPYDIYIDSLPTAFHRTYLYQGHTYIVNVTLHDRYQVCMGDIIVKIGNQQVGRKVYCTTGSYAVSFDVPFVLQGQYYLTCSYTGGWDRDTTGAYITPFDTAPITIVDTQTVIQPTTITPTRITGIYPNPASNVLNIRMPSPQDTITEVRLMNLSGQVVALLYPHAADVVIPVGNIAAGMYLLQVRTPGGVRNEKVVVAR
ncbi:MAG: T9SS type A sorting domain-containing protein [Bacteroidota bacterium]